MASILVLVAAIANGVEAKRPAKPAVVTRKKSRRPTQSLVRKTKIRDCCPKFEK